jgi:hypothetical protein
VFLKSNSKNLVFIDDDEWPKRSDWLQAISTQKDNSAADIVTGTVETVLEPGAPKWAAGILYAQNKFSEGDIVPCFYTNNLLISRVVLENVSPAFDQRFAMTGASDYHFALKCSKLGFKAIYANAPVQEEFPKSRAKVRWFIKRGFRSGIGYTRAHIFEDSYLLALIKICIMFLLRGGRGIILLLIGCIGLNKRLFVTGAFRMAAALGTIAGIFGIKYDEYNVIHGK